MGNTKDLTGKRFGKLIVVELTSKRTNRCVIWRCMCDCGKYSLVRSDCLISGLTKSCGCLRRKLAKELGEKNFKHGHAHSFYKATPTYESWSGMVQRCLNSNNKNYKDWGGRGIKICDRWLGEHGFENFLEDMGEKPKGTTFDRKDNGGNYEQGNCGWVTPKEQANNRRQHFIPGRDI